MPYLRGGLPNANPGLPALAPSPLPNETWLLILSRKSARISLHITMAPVWHFVRRRYSDDVLNASGELKEKRMWCLLRPCPADNIIGGHGPSNAAAHLERHHRLTKDDMIRQFKLLCQCGCEGVPHEGEVKTTEELKDARRKLLVKRTQRRFGITAHARAQQEGLAAPPGLMPPTRQAATTACFTRQVIVGDLRVSTLGEGDGFKEWVDIMAMKTQAKYKWRPATHQEVDQVMAADEPVIWHASHKLLASVHPERRQGHQDGWTDCFKRHWVLGYETFLCPTTVEFKRIVYCFQNCGKHVDPLSEQGKQTAAVQTRALESGWRQHIGDLRRGTRGVSDSCNTAVAVTRLLGQTQRRCIVHIVVIPERRLLCHPSTYQQEDEKKDMPLPVHFEAMEMMRKIALYYFRDAPHHRTYKKNKDVLQIVDANVVPPKPDTSKWESRQQLAEHGREKSTKLRVLQDVADQAGTLKTPQPPMPRGAHLKALQEVPPVLDLVQATLSELQGDDKTLADFMPTLAGLRNRLASMTSQFSKTYLKELNEAMQRHMSEIALRSGAHMKPWTSMQRLANACSLCLPKYRQGKFLEVAERLQAKEDLRQACRRAYLREHPGKSLKDPAPLDTACSEAPAKKRKVERKLPGHDALMAAMDEAAGIAPASEEPAVEADGAEQAEAVAVVSDRTIGALMDSQLDTWCSGGPIVDVSWQAFWRKAENRKTFSCILDGVLDLLGEQSHNAWGERFFSKAARVITKLAGNLDVERKLCEHNNGPECKITGYVKATWWPTAVDKEFWEGPSDTIECGTA